MDVNIGKGITLAVDESKLPANAMAHVIYIGLRNVLMDSHASVTTDEEDYVTKATAMAQKKLDALLSGEVRVASTREGDPVKAEANKIATRLILAALRKKGKKPADIDPKAIREATAKLLAKDPRIMVTAKANVDAAKALDVDASDLV